MTEDQILATLDLEFGMSLVNEAISEGEQLGLSPVALVRGKAASLGLTHEEINMLVTITRSLREGLDQ